MEIELIKVDRKDEFAVFKVLDYCNLYSFALFALLNDGRGGQEKVLHTYTFPNINVSTGDFITLYTCKGEDTKFKNQGETTTHKLYWNLENPVWTAHEIKARIVKIEERKTYRL